MFGTKGLELFDAGRYLPADALLAVRVTSTGELFLFPDEKLFDAATGLGILDLFAWFVWPEGLTLDPFSSLGLPRAWNAFSVPWMFDNIDVTVAEDGGLFSTVLSIANITEAPGSIRLDAFVDLIRKKKMISAYKFL